MVLAIAVLVAGVFMSMWVLLELADRWFTKSFHDHSLKKRVRSQPNEDDPEFLEFIAEKVRDHHYDADD